MRKFETEVQHLKYMVLREVVRQHWAGTLEENILDIPKIIIPGKVPTMRCCVYKERAIIAERVKLACGGMKKRKNVIEVIDIACDECPMGGYEVTNACRGCIAHRCENACKFGAISFDEKHVAHIDKTKCKECGSCSKVCPYSAIFNYKRPCEQACKVKAISMGDEKQACIDDSKCISCGACVLACPFGAISDKSFIRKAVDILKNKTPESEVFAIVAPSIATQFVFAKPGQVISGLKQLGFDTVLEAAIGADMVTEEETKELAEKGFLTSSCCPAFVSYIEKNMPELKEFISGNTSPMVTLSKYLKEHHPGCKTVFIGPCIAKKAESLKDSVKPYVDVAITFEELQALFSARKVELKTLEEDTTDNASYFGRIFARTGGLSEAVAESVREQNIDLEVKPVVCEGIEQCRIALLQKKVGRLDANFIEGMACIGGCVGGPGCLTHGGDRDKASVDKFAKLSTRESIKESLESFTEKDKK